MKLLAAISLLLPLAASAAGAQQLGFSGSYGVGVLETERTTDAWRAWCGCEARGTSLAQQTLLAVTYLQRNDAPIGAAARLGVGISLAQFISPSYPPAPGDLPADAALEFRERLRAISVRADLEGRLATGGPAWLTFGPWFDYLLQASLERTEHIVGPAGAVFPGDATERPLSARAPDAPPSLRWGLFGGVSLEVELSSGVHLVLQPSLQADVTRLANEQPGALLFVAGSSVVFDIQRLAPRPAPVAPLVLPEPEPVAPAPPRASVDLYALRDGARVQTADVRRELVYRRSVAPMPVAVDFVRATTTISSYYHQRGPDDFAIDSLAGADPRTYGRHVLEAIGARMRASRDARLRLAGTYLPEEGAELGRERASAIRMYLATTWGIDASRVAVASEPGSTPRVRIASAASRLLAPIVTEWLDERFRLPSLGVDPEIDAAGGVRSSVLRLSHDADMLAETAVDRERVLPAIAIDLADAMRTGEAAPIVAELVVVDSTGAAVTAVDRLPLALPSASDTTSMPGRARIEFAIDECDDATPCLDRSMLDELARIEPGARVRLVRGPVARSQAPVPSVVDELRAYLARRGIAVEEAIDDRDDGVQTTRRVLLVVEQHAP